MAPRDIRQNGTFCLVSVLARPMPWVIIGLASA